MDIGLEIAKHVELLPIPQQEQVLRFVVALTHEGTPPGTPGVDLLKFAGSIDPVSAREMQEAIENECERVDAAQW